MANTYTQIYIQVVFAVEGRQSLIAPEHNDELQKYITGIVSGQKHKLIAINNMPDHLHLLIGLRPNAALSELVRDIKANSSRFINDTALAKPGSPPRSQSRHGRHFCSTIPRKSPAP